MLSKTVALSLALIALGLAGYSTYATAQIDEFRLELAGLKKDVGRLRALVTAPPTVHPAAEIP